MCSVLQAALSGAGGSHRCLAQCFRARCSREIEHASVQRLAGVALQALGRAPCSKQSALHALLADQALWQAYN